MSKLARYRMKTHEKLNYGQVVNACLDKDVTELETRLAQALRERDEALERERKLQREFCKTVVVQPQLQLTKEMYAETRGWDCFEVKK